MPCFFCGSPENTAEVRVFIEGEKRTIRLCALCAAERGIFLDQGRVRIDLDELTQTFPHSENSGNGSVCPSCGATRESVVFTGAAGCAECYVRFREDLLPLFQDDGDSRTDRFQSLLRTQGFRKLIREAEGELASSVAREDYERASGLRDKIRELKEKLRESYEF